MSQPAHPPPATQARAVLRGASHATLATIGPGGHPHTALVTPAVAPDGTILLLLSELAAHTAHLHADPRCSLLLAAPPPGANPQAAARLSLAARAEPILPDDPALRATWLARHPYADTYADFADFALWRLRPTEDAHFIAGFAAAHPLPAASLAPAPPAAAAIAACAAAFIAHCNDHHPETLALLARAAGHRHGAWRLVSVSPDGLDLAQDLTVLHIPWGEELPGADAVSDALIRLAAQARAAG